MADPLRLERDRGLAVVTFDSPPLNLFNDQLRSGLADAVAELESNTPRAVLFRAEGRVFSGGAEVSVFSSLAGSTAARAFAHELAAGPTLAHAATKDVIRAYLDGGVEGANDRVGQVAGELFDTEDLQAAVRSFLEQGPGKATFAGR